MLREMYARNTSLNTAYNDIGTRLKLALVQECFTSKKYQNMKNVYQARNVFESCAVSQVQKEKTMQANIAT